MDREWLSRGRLRPLGVGLAVGVLATAGSYLFAGRTAAFVATPVARAVVSHTPAAVVAFSIVVLGTLGDSIGFALALALTVVAFGATYWLAALATDDRIARPVATAGVAWALAVALTFAPAVALGAAIPAGAGAAIEGAPLLRGDGSVVPARRRALALGATTVGFGALAYALGDRARRQPQSLSGVAGGPRNQTHSTSGAKTGAASAPANASASTSGGGSPSAAQRLLQTASDRSLDVGGLGGLVSEIGLFYTVDVDSIDPSVDAANWRLDVTGTVASPVTLSFDDLTAREPIHRFKTLRCVGEHLNGRLMDNALWTGVPIADLLDEAQPSGDTVVLRATDGYYESFPLNALRGGMLAYGMNDRLLPTQHGHPVRALVPGHWGEINVKWITKIEVRDGGAPSYWEKRGWHGTGPVRTVAKLWATNHLGDGRVQVGGFAYAGTRGVRSVEVSTDGGKRWTDARLSDPLDEADVLAGRDAWRQWEHTWRPSGRSSDVVVRAVDGTGARQPAATDGPYPNGASGWVEKTVRSRG